MMRYFLLVLTLISYNAHSTSIVIPEEPINKTVIYNYKLPLPRTHHLSLDPLEERNSSLSQPGSLPLSLEFLSLNLKGKLSLEDIHRLGESHYKTISLYRAYSQETLPCLKDNSFILSPSTFNPNVQDLSLRVCGLTDEHIKEVGYFKKLETLKLHNNRLTERGVNFISSLSQLKILDLGANDLNDLSIEKILSSMLDLTELDISNNKNVTGKCLNSMSNHPSLKKLNIKMTSITRQEFKDFKKYAVHLTKVDYFPRFSDD